MAAVFKITQDHLRWADNKRKKHAESRRFWINLIQQQKGKCALTDVPLLFNAEKYGTSKKNRPSCHPLYAAVDYIENNHDGEFRLLCYDIYVLKGNLPESLFAALTKTKEWKRFANKWKRLASSSKSSSPFKKLISQGK